MRKLFLAAGVAALAIAAPATAKPDKPDRGPKAAKVERGGGASQARAQARGGGEARAARQASRPERSARQASRPERAAVQVQSRGGGEARSQRRGAPEARLATMQSRGNSEARVRGNNRTESRARGGNRDDVRARGNSTVRVADRPRGNVRSETRARANERPAVNVRGGNDRVRVVEQRRGSDRDLRVRDRDWDDRRVVRERGGDRTIVRDRVRVADWTDRDRWVRSRAVALSGGCPPGLANKNPLCMPPGQYKKLQGTVLPATFARNVLPRDFRYLYPDTNRYYYRYGDGHVYRVDRESNLVRALLPLIGAGLGIGQPFPFTSPAYHLPAHFQPFYPATDRFDYRYADGYIYEVDRFTGRITDVIPQYDHGFGVGQMLPASYGYYNLPDPYRQWYVDDDDYYYRYAPGAIYRVDRGTNLITSIVSLLAGGLGVGQPLPMGYDAYNVPFAYRDRYYDTPDHWYRYANGHIYQVDPTTRLITAVINALV